MLALLFHLVIEMRRKAVGVTTGKGRGGEGRGGGGAASDGQQGTYVMTSLNRPPLAALTAQDDLLPAWLFPHDYSLRRESIYSNWRSICDLLIVQYSIILNMLH